MKERIAAYYAELAGNGPTVNYSHLTLRALYRDYGQEFVESYVKENPPHGKCRQIYSIQ